MTFFDAVFINSLSAQPTLTGMTCSIRYALIVAGTTDVDWNQEPSRSEP